MRTQKINNGKVKGIKTLMVCFLVTVVLVIALGKVWIREVVIPYTQQSRAL